MAEFTEVMRQAKRMCKSYGDACGPCVLHEKYGLCPLCAQTDDHIPADWKLDNMPEVERSVMDWAAKHPEPRFPTWAEWHDTMFAESFVKEKPCPKFFLDQARGEILCAESEGCPDCWKTTIPADIAEKLGIKPMGGSAE